MSKIKELWTKNKILWVLLFILLICFITIIVVSFTFFFGGNESEYGDRLKELESHEIAESFKSEYEEVLENDELISDASIRISGRIIYINIKFNNDTPLFEAQSKATASLEKFTDDILNYYDINFILLCDATDNSDGFTILGARNVSGSGIVWNNNTKIESEEEE